MLNGALLYYHHSCQKGKTDAAGQELCRSTPKSAEGYAAMLLFKKVKEDGMHVVIHGQDALILRQFILCSFSGCRNNDMGRAFRHAHKIIIIESRQKLKQFGKSFFEKRRGKFPAIASDCEDESHSDTCVRFCHCTGNHSAGLGA